MGNSKYNDEFKQKVFNDKHFNTIREQRRKMTDFDNPYLIFNEDNGEVQTRYPFDCEAWFKLKGLYRSVGKIAEFDCVERLLRSGYKRRGRILKKITNLILYFEAYFVMLTFSPKVLANTTPEQRKRIVQRYLKKYCETYVANVDFGGKKGREHYHAIVTNKINLKEWAEKYGIISIKKIHSGFDDVKRLSAYIAKLTNHAIKNKAFNMRVIYSRNVK